MGERVPLNSLCSKGKSTLRQKDLNTEGLYPVYGASGIIGYMDTYQNEHEYIAVVKDGAGVGRATICSGKSSVLGTMQALLPNEGVECGYLLHLVRTLNLGSGFSGSTIPHIYFKDYGKRLVPSFSLKGQKDISARFDKIESQINLGNRILERCGQLVKSQFVEMFGDPTNGVAWPSKRLDEICTIVTGNTPPRKDPSNYGDYIEWCKTDNITDAKYLTTASEMLSEEGALRGRVVPAGSILMACIAGSVKSIGKVAVADRSVAFNQQINALIPSEMIDVEYLLWALRLSKDYLCSGVNIQLKGILNKTSLSAKSFCVPPLALQQQFAAFVAEVDKSRFVVQRQIEKLRTLYDSLAQEYFG